MKITLDYIKKANYSLVHNGMELCQSLDVVNNGSDDCRNVVVRCEGECFTTLSSPVIACIPSGGAVRVKGFTISPDIKKMATLTEHVRTMFSVIVSADNGEKELCSEDFQIELMPYDHWLGYGLMPQTIASFVTPNHPAVSQLVVKAARYLKEITGSSSFVEYQSGNPDDVMNQVAAIYAALHDESIVYRALPASYEETGQRVTLPDEVLSGKLGNCIELTVLFASVLESVGINSCIVFKRGHAYLAVWLVDDCCHYSVCDDSSFIEKKCSKGIGEMIVVESTNISSEKTSFEDALKAAELHLADISTFDMFVDIRRCRLERVLPLPQRVQKNGPWEIDTEGVKHDECIINVRESSRYDLNKIVANDKELSKMDIWERKLLDFSLRNNMLNLYLRQKAIQFVSFNVDKIEDHLQEGEEYQLMEKPNVDIKFSDEERLVRSKLYPDLQQLVSNDIEHRILHTYHTEGETMSTLKNIYRSARNAIEETGANSLYLAIGTLRWFETEHSEMARYAPILMLPVEMVYKKGAYFIRTCDEDIMLNVTLVEFLRQNYDIQIPDLSALPKDEHGVNVSLVFAILRDALKNKKRWDVEEECILGVFSFSKFLMWNDIHNHRDELLQSEVISSLVEQRLTWQPDDLTSTLKDKDKVMTPDQLALPVAADSSQMAAVYEAGLGHSFILYGPPGTGKSQTITNLIANALFQGKRVLFVAEKMAALSVVQSRLAKIGLDPFCLEIHSNKVTKRHVLDQLAKALNVTHIVRPEDYKHTAEQLYQERTKLIAYMEALHENKGSDGLSLYDCIIRYEQLEGECLKAKVVTDELLKSFNVQTIGEYEFLLGGKLDAVIRLVGHPSKHPLVGLDVTDGDLADVSRLDKALAEAMAIISKCADDHEHLKEADALRENILKDCSEAFLAEDADALYQEWRAVKAKWFIPRFFAKRSYMKKLRAYSPHIVEADIDSLLERLDEYQKSHKRIVELHAVCTRYFGNEYALDEMPSKQALADMSSRIGSWSHHTNESRDWYQWCECRREMCEKGLGAIVEALETTDIKTANIKDVTFRTIYKQLAMKKISESGALRTFEGMLFDESVEQYKKLTADFQLLSQKELYAKLAAQIPHVTDSIDSSSEIGLLNRNISNGGRGMSLRDLMDQIPTLMPRLCPCMLMSPMSVAQYLSLTQDKFDLVIFDEASQMPTSEAVGAIARGKALVVVGDPKQMPPTSFFNSTNVNEDEAELDDMESILEDCRTLEIPSLQLNWHYRSQHESLIAFSNNEYYDGSLITFPSVDDQTTKVKYVPVDGVYDKGGKRCNKAEAEAIVKEVKRRLGDADLCRHSIGVIAFSVVQQNLIEDMLQDMLESNVALREAADGMYEPIFVKNLENVQGDERDVILFSIGYGPDKDGKVSMNFGPLNNSGGERRLNVAVSRARQEMMVFSTLKSSQVDLRRSKAKGVEGLKHFLEYAEQQIIIQSEATLAANNDVVIAKKIADAIAAKGYVTNVNVGRSQFKVSVAVSSKEQPDVYMLGILLDGEGYHTTQTTRDREIVQPSVLNNLKWKVMRVWSVDWINTPQRVIDRILEKLQEKPAPTPAPKTPTPTFDISKEKVVEQETCAVEYKEYAGAVSSSDATLVRNIVKTEQPISLMQLCRRVCSLRDVQRVTPTIQKTVREIAEKSFYVQPDRKGFVVWTDKAACDEYASYRQASGRDVTDIPLAEIKNAVLEAIREQFAISVDSLSLIAAKKLGFTRRGANVDEAFNLAANELLNEGKIEIQDGKMTCTE